MLTLAGLARAAYAHGWALSEGPLTDRVRAGVEVAMALAVEHREQPGIVEALADLGYWEGVSATVTARRDGLEAGNLTALRPRWLALTAATDRDRLTRGLLRRTVTHEAAPRPPLNSGADADSLAALIQGALEKAADSDRPGYQTTRQAFRDAVARAQAEGRVSALAAGAKKLDRPGSAFQANLAYQDALAGLDHTAGLWTDADTWLHTLMGYASRDIGRAIARLEQPDETQVREILEQFLDDPDARALSTAVDQLTGRSVIQGVLNLYAQSGITTLDMVAMPGACPKCLDAASNSPYRIGRQPPVPVHPNCLIGSTRVSAAALVVAGDVPHRLSGDTAVSAVGIGGNGGALAAAACAESGGDFGRGNIRAVTVREYVGQAVTIRTARGHELTGTPNHPIATPGGWVALADLEAGDHVLSSTRPEWVTAAVNPDVDSVPPRIEDLAETFPVAFGPVPTAAEDFHGDGTGSDVHVVRADRFLLDHGHASGAEHVGEQVFGDRDVAVVDDAFTAGGTLSQDIGAVFGAADGGVGGIGESNAFLGGGLSHAGPHGRAAVADLYARLFQPAGQHVAADAEGFCERVNALACDVAADEIVHVERTLVSTHVYNLETVDGYYIGNGIMTHNCRCDIYPHDQVLPESAISPYLSTRS